MGGVHHQHSSASSRPSIVPTPSIGGPGPGGRAAGRRRSSAAPVADGAPARKTVGHSARPRRNRRTKGARGPSISHGAGGARFDFPTTGVLENITGSHNLDGGEQPTGSWNLEEHTEKHRGPLGIGSAGPHGHGGSGGHHLFGGGGNSLWKSLSKMFGCVFY